MLSKVHCWQALHAHAENKSSPKFNVSWEISYSLGTTTCAHSIAIRGFGIGWSATTYRIAITGLSISSTTTVFLTKYKSTRCTLFTKSINYLVQNNSCTFLPRGIFDEVQQLTDWMTVDTLTAIRQSPRKRQCNSQLAPNGFIELHATNRCYVSIIWSMQGGDDLYLSRYK